MANSIKGYKVTNPDNTCLGFKFKVGQTYKIKGDLVICHNGFHFCQKATNCFGYYNFDSANKVFEVEAIGDCVTDGDKTATSEIKIIREIPWIEVLSIVNTGKDNTGRDNSGDSNSGYRNSGDRNSGDRNSGDRNSGDRNSGDRNSGYSNSGDRNSGNWNSGDRNSGNWNSGDRNSGDSNSGYRNSGAFCIDQNPVLWLFDSPSKMTVREWERSEVYRAMSSLLENGIWVYSSEMTTEEKEKYPTHETTGGYLKMKTTHEMWADAWHNMDDKKRALFTSLENFDPKKFLLITGIDVTH